MADPNPFSSNSVEAPKFGDTFDADPDAGLAPLVNEAEALRIIEQARIENRRAKMAAKGVPDPTLGAQPHPMAGPGGQSVRHFTGAAEDGIAKSIQYVLQLRQEYRQACQRALAEVGALSSPLSEPLEALLRIVLEG